MWNRFLTLSKGLAVFSFFVVTACDEPEFVGDRPVNLSVLNKPYQMKKIDLGGQSYLAVVNTNYTTDFKTGSMHFYDLSDPSNPTRNEALDLEIPSNVSDFELVEMEDGSLRLFILDRNDSRLIPFDFVDGVFQKFPVARADEDLFETFFNPQSILRFRGEPDDTDYLAILSQSGATIQFFDIERMRNFDEEDLELVAELLDEQAPEALNLIQFISRRARVGASFEMRVRGTERARGISSAERRGRGMGKMMLMESAENGPVLVGASYTNDAIFGFRFNSFDNNANLLWNPRQAVRGGDGLRGTREAGFRGMDQDEAGFFYFSSRSDNGIYRVPQGLFDEDRVASNRANTTYFGEDAQDYRLNFEFEALPEEEIFPRLGDLAVSADGSRLYVLGLESKRRGFDFSRVYMLDLADPNAPVLLDETGEDDFSAEDRPQKLFLDRDAELLIVAVTGANRLQIYDVSGSQFNLLSTLSRPETLE